MANSLLLIDKDAFVMNVTNVGAQMTISDEIPKPSLTLSNIGPTLTLKDLP